MILKMGYPKSNECLEEQVKMTSFEYEKQVFVDEANGFYFRVVEAQIDRNENKAILKVAYDDSENPELVTYVRKAYLDESVQGDVYNAYVNGLKIRISSFEKKATGELEYFVCYIGKQYDTKGYKKLNSGYSKKSHQTSDNGEAVKNNIQEKVEDEKPISNDWSDKQVRHNKYDTIKTCLMANIPVYLAGPAGSGKNFTVEQICKELGWDFYFSNSVQQEYKLTGFIDAGGRFHETEFYKACVSDNDCVFFLDEVDASIPEVLVLLNAAIANGYFEFPEKRVDLKHVHFVAAGNTVGSGSDELYTGRMVIDQATLDRFAIVDFDYDTNVELHIALGDGKLVGFIHNLRDSAQTQGIRATFSYRAIAMVVKLKNSLGLKEVLAIAVFKGLDKDTVKQLVANANLRGMNEYSKAALEMVA